MHSNLGAGAKLLFLSSGKYTDRSSGWIRGVGYDGEAGEVES